MRKLAVALCLAGLTACSPSSGGSPSGSPTPGASGSPAAGTITMTGATTTTFSGAPQCILSTSLIASQQKQTLVFTGIRSTTGLFLYMSVFPVTGKGRYGVVAGRPGSQLSVSNTAKADALRTWTGRSGTIVVGELSDRAGGTIDIDLAESDGHASAPAHLSGSWSCSVTRAAVPSPRPTVQPSPSK